MEEKKEAIRNYTHYAKFYGIPCYYNIEDDSIDGRNKFFDFLLSIAIWIEYKFPSAEDGFPIELGRRIEKDEKL